MREIKFRCWHPNKRQLVYLDWKEIADHGDCQMKMSSHHFAYQVWLNFLLPAHNINGKYQEDPYIDLNGIEWMQYTGFKDKNGNEIYEGDILDHDTAVGDFLGAVTWHDKDGYYFIEGNSDNKLGIYGKHSEVVGNLYENPELLTK